MKRLMRVTLGAMLLAAATSAASNDAASNEDVVNEAAVIDAVVNEAAGGDAIGSDAAADEAAGDEAVVNEVTADEAIGNDATANEAPADAAVGSEDARVEEPAIPQEVDLFPSQPWASLVGGNAPQAPNGAPGSDTSQAAEPDALAPEQAKGEPELVRVPIHAVGEWIDDAHRIVVLESQGQTYLLCQRCSIADALRPGDTVAQQYQFKALEPSRAVLIDPKGREQHVDLAPLAQ
ncbi:hypothetical protein [Achromobacter kerstersii]|jgi:hypothetical protein|uniref:Uncharacterized protein n=1 Tax=Achromobacter kerstersii TaxID=1353890 RepID=A0A6S7ALS8_9BURK|nr:hypothetical protein [Achromobacter kerstersii]CAB3725485.1 hypothetical protein LMG3441_04208 [Achromobacter kerstersii]